VTTGGSRDRIDGSIGKTLLRVRRIIALTSELLWSLPRRYAVD
jgi:hypothetical protein